MNKPLSEHTLLLDERFYYQEKKIDAMDLPPGDERAIRLDIYSKIIDVLNAAIFGNQRASTERIQELERQMDERLNQIT